MIIKFRQLVYLLEKDPWGTPTHAGDTISKSCDFDKFPLFSVIKLGQ